MSLFIDASALVAMITNEPERDLFRDRVLTEGDPLWSAMACWEAVSAVRRRGELTVDAARELVMQSADFFSLRLVSVGQRELSAALDAYQTYGRNSGHPAKLNMGDCFGYAVAAEAALPILFKGDDFSRTDLPTALPRS